jgi:putative iron-dependent peroxidase
MASAPVTGTQALGGQAIVPQPLAVPLTRAAIFLVLTVNAGTAHRTAVRSLCGELAAMVRSVGSRDPGAHLSCVMGIGADAWARLFGPPLPAAHHPFREIRADSRVAVSTPGDLLFHIRAERMDLCFELAGLIMTRLNAAVTLADEVHGFQYFDNRNLLGFVDGTENPTEQEAIQVGEEDPAFAGGGYIIVQKYLHDVAGWNALSTEIQERIIGRSKSANIDLDASVKPSAAHNALTTIVENGVELKILRANMPFGQPGTGEFGTYFIGYSRTPRITELMLENMFIGRPPGNYDRLLDFSRPVTGGLFFAPAATFLDSVTEDSTTPPSPPPTLPSQPARDGSLGIGSLKGKPRS